MMFHVTPTTSRRFGYLSRDIRVSCRFIHHFSRAIQLWGSTLLARNRVRVLATGAAVPEVCRVLFVDVGNARFIAFTG